MAVSRNMRLRAGARLRMLLVFVAFFLIGLGAALLVRQTGGIELAKIAGLSATGEISFVTEPWGTVTG